jgi:hypothetical protein
VIGWTRAFNLALPSARPPSIPFRAKPRAGFYVFGSAAFVVFMLQIVTGHHAGAHLRALPPVKLGTAFRLLITASPWAGSFAACTDGGSDFMVAIVLIHMVQVFLFGAYKYPRELTWIVGVFSLANDPWHGLHRASSQILIKTPTGVLESGHRLRAAFPLMGTSHREFNVGRPDHRWSNSFEILRPSRVSSFLGF